MPASMSARSWPIVFSTTSYFTFVFAFFVLRHRRPGRPSAFRFRGRRAAGVVEAAGRQRGDVEVVDGADLRRRQAADLRRGGKRRRGRFDRRAHGRGRGRVDALAEHDEVQERSALARRQRDRVDVGLEVALVTCVRQRVVEGVVEPVAGEGHRAAKGCRRVGVPMTVTCGPPTSVSSRERRGHFDPRVGGGDHRVAAGGVDDRARVVRRTRRCPDWPPNATLIVSGAFVVLVKVSSQRPQFALRLM